MKEAQEFQVKHGIPFFIETSAKTGQNVETIFVMAAKILQENFKDRLVEMVSTSRISEYLAFVGKTIQKLKSNS